MSRIASFDASRLRALLSQLWLLIWPGTAAPAFAIAGAAGLLAAGMQAPIAAVAFIVELTHTINASLVLILLTIGRAVVVTRGLEPRSIYCARLLPRPGESATATPAAKALAGGRRSPRPAVRLMGGVGGA